MDRNCAQPGTQNLGELITASYELGSALAPDQITAGELAALHLERVLVRGSNARITAALADLARELAPGNFDWTPATALLIT